MPYTNSSRTTGMTATGLPQADFVTCSAPECEERAHADVVFCRRHRDMLPERLINALRFGLRNGKRKYWKDAIRDSIAYLHSHPDSRGDTVLITGNTFAVREELKRMGFHWSEHERGWRGPRDMKMAAEVLVGNAAQVEHLPGLTDDDLG